jgi:hypothetical protein
MEGPQPMKYPRSLAVKFRTIIFSLAIGGISVVGNASQLPNKSEVKHMISTAHTPDDFQRLADYYDQRSAEFERKAGQQEKELDRLLALPFHARSYPTQVETTRNLISNYKTQASTSAGQAREYRRHAKTLAGEAPSGAVAPVK